VTVIPFIDLVAQYHGIKDEVDEAIGRVLETGQFVLGDEVDAFEREFALLAGTSQTIAVNSGTAALHLALVAAGIGAGDEVITVPFTFVASVAAICHAGARPVLVDIDAKSFTIDVRQIEAAITPRTKAILPVHLYGQAADIEPVRSIADRHGLIVIEDAAQAHGSLYQGRPCGSLGDLACFSFYPSKNLGACGEGGLIATSNEALADRLRLLRNWGQAAKYLHVIPGFNARMDALQAAILRVKLRHLPRWTEARRRHAARYQQLLAGTALALPEEMPYAHHVYYLYTVRSREREALRAALAADGIATGVHYPRPVHLQPAYESLGYRQGSFPVSERASEEVLSLPLFPELTCAQIETVAAAIRARSVSG
jgi:dTDP-4-amino-4,6-dideoxygalactose transaminase